LLTGADKQIHRICDHWARCLLGVSAVHDGGSGRLPWDHAASASNAPGVPGVSHYGGTYMHASSPAGPGLTPRRPGPVLYAMRSAAAALARPIWALLSGWLRQLTDRCQHVASELGQSQKVTSAWRPCGRIADSERLTTVLAERSVAYRSPASGVICPSRDRSHPVPTTCSRRSHGSAAASAMLNTTSIGRHDTRWMTIQAELTTAEAFMEHQPAGAADPSKQTPDPAAWPGGSGGPGMRSPGHGGLEAELIGNFGDVILARPRHPLWDCWR